MQLKRRLAGSGSRRGVPAGRGSLVAPLVWSGALASALHFREEPANGGCLRLGGRLGRWLCACVETVQPGRAAVRRRPRRALRSFARCGAGRLRSAAALRREVSRSDALRAVLRDGRGFPVVEARQLAPRSLASEWLHPTRLETRTKECNMRASLWVANPSAQ